MPCASRSFSMLKPGLLGGIDNHGFAPANRGRGVHHLVGHVVRNHHRAVLVGMHQVAVVDAHAADVDRAAERHHVYEGMGGAHAVGQHLKALRHVRQVAHAAVGDHAQAPQALVDVAVHFAPERAVAARVAVEILDDGDGRLGAAVVDIVVVVARVGARVRRVLGANSGGAGVAHHHAEFRARANQRFHGVAVAAALGRGRLQRVADRGRVDGCELAQQLGRMFGHGIPFRW